MNDWIGRRYREFERGAWMASYNYGVDVDPSGSISSGTPLFVGSQTEANLRAVPVIEYRPDRRLVRVVDEDSSLRAAMWVKESELAPVVVRRTGIRSLSRETLLRAEPGTRVVIENGKQYAVDDGLRITTEFTATQVGTVFHGPPLAEKRWGSGFEDAPVYDRKGGRVIGMVDGNMHADFITDGSWYKVVKSDGYIRGTFWLKNKIDVGGLHGRGVGSIGGSHQIRLGAGVCLFDARGKIAAVILTSVFCRRVATTKIVCPLHREEHTFHTGPNTKELETCITKARAELLNRDGWKR